MAALPPRQREAAARLALAAHVPASGAMSSLAWKDGTGHAWTWVDPPSDVIAGQQAWIPESLLAPVPEHDGARLLRMADGVEGQVWKNGHLAASQWWGRAPDAEAWGRFLRSAGLDQAPPPEAQSFQWRREPWAAQARTWLPGSAEARERLAWVAAAALLALLLGWQVTAFIRWSMASSGISTRLEATRSEIAPLLAARERAEIAQSEMLRLRELQVGTSDYELMTQVVGALPEGTRLMSWRREPGKLVAVITGSGTDPRELVSAFVASPVLSEVVAVPVPAGMQLTFDLRDDGKTTEGAR